jgi:dephospho-CoA kinase
MTKLGLTANRYSGLDSVARIFKSISIPVFDADVLVKFLLHYNFEINHNIRVALGSKYFNSTDLDFLAIKRDGKFDHIVDIIETEVFSAFKKFQNKHANSIYTVFKSSILFESGWNKKMDFIATIKAEDYFRINLCKEETSLDYSEILLLISSEFPLENKLKSSDYTIINNGGPDRLKESVNVVDLRIIDDYLYKEKINSEKKKRDIIYIP